MSDGAVWSVRFSCSGWPEENDFALGFEPVFFTTSQAGQPAAHERRETLKRRPIDIAELKKLDIIITCQGGDYTKAVHPELRQGWQGYWIDAASTLRMEDNAVIILDPVNRNVIDAALTGAEDFIGGNCTVSLMLMGLGGLFRAGLVEWLSSMTYQAASGAGAPNMRELLSQMGVLQGSVAGLLAIRSRRFWRLTGKLRPSSAATPCRRRNSAAPPWPETCSPGSTGKWGRPEPGGMERAIPKPTRFSARQPNRSPLTAFVSGSAPCAATARGLPSELKKDLPLADIENLIANDNQWAKLVPNTKAETLAGLTPAAVSGTLTVPVGRVRKMKMGPQYLQAFTCGDQLLWGAAEPLRRMLRILLEK